MNFNCLNISRQIYVKPSIIWPCVIGTFYPIISWSFPNTVYIAYISICTLTLCMAPAVRWTLDRRLTTATSTCSTRRPPVIWRLSTRKGSSFRQNRTTSSPTPATRTPSGLATSRLVPRSNASSVSATTSSRFVNCCSLEFVFKGRLQHSVRLRSRGHRTWTLQLVTTVACC